MIGIIIITISGKGVLKVIYLVGKYPELLKDYLKYTLENMNKKRKKQKKKMMSKWKKFLLMEEKRYIKYGILN